MFAEFVQIAIALPPYYYSHNLHSQNPWEVLIMVIANFLVYRHNSHLLEFVDRG